MDHMGFKILGPLHLIVVGPKDPSPADWAAYLDAVRAEQKKGIDVGEIRTLVFSDGGGPNAAMRKAVSDILQGRTSPVAIVTGNPMMRGIITALSWFNSQCRAFAPNEIGAALRFLQVPERKVDSIQTTAHDLVTTLGLEQVAALNQAKFPGQPATTARP
jgi:hypothetical protein